MADGSRVGWFQGGKRKFLEYPNPLVRMLDFYDMKTARLLPTRVKRGFGSAFGDVKHGRFDLGKKAGYLHDTAR